MNTVLKVENLSKQYRLGKVGTGTVSHDLNRWWAKVRGKEDPFLKVGEVNDRSKKGESEYVWALQDINFEVEQGQAIGIIGRNGAGKSTLLKLLSRITKPTTGTIHYKGRIASLLEVGTGFHPEMTGRENIYLNGAILGMTRKEIIRKFDEIVDFAGVERYIDTPVKRYSSGMYVRLAFAVAAHLESEILIVDEVLAVGDAEFQKKCLGKMSDVTKNEGRTVLFVSHNMAAVQNLCTKGIYLEYGKISFKGEVHQCISEYMTKNNKLNLELNERKDRVGNGNVRLVNLSINEGHVLKTWDDVIVKMDIEVVDNVTEINEVGLSIWDENEIKIISLSSTFKNQLKNISENGTVICEIPKLPLVNGIYSINAFLSSPFGLEDYVENILNFEVEQNDVFGYGKTVNPRWGRIVVEHNWNLYDTE